MTLPIAFRPAARLYARRSPGLRTVLLRTAVLLTSAGILPALSGCSQPLGLSPGSQGLMSPGYGGMSGGYTGEMNGGLTSAGLRGTPARRGAEASASVRNGLGVATEGKWQIRVAPGSCTIADKPVVVSRPAVLTEEPGAAIPVHAEKLVLGNDPPRSFDHGTRLAALVSDSTTLPGALDPASLRVWSAPAPPRALYRPGVDYLVDPEWGELSRKPGGAISEGQPVFVDYSVRQMRIDTIEVKRDGSVELKKGTPARTAPEPAAADPGAFALAHLFVPYGAAKLTSDDIFLVGEPFPQPTAQERQAMAAAVSRTRAKLQAGAPVTLAFWGDSVTAGGTASTPSHRFPDLIASALETEFKDSRVTLLNAGVGGSNIDGRLPALPKDVLSHHPDLVVIEFVNDMGLPLETLRRDYTAAIKEIRAAGSEVIVTTPHFTMPEWMKMRSLHGHDPRPGVAVIRQVALREHAGLADVSQRWQHLAEEGMPYVALLYNGINHPDDRGHEIYARAIEAFFQTPAAG